MAIDPVSPIRDPSQLGPTEDLDREPDGVPHDVVGLTALFAVVLAVLALAMLMTGWVGIAAGAILIALAVPTMWRLDRRASAERSITHPSR
jgi:hypothetical protein